MQLKLIDFGCATFLRHTPLKDRLRVINDVYSAPEVLNSRKEGRIVLGRYTDLYRCGALLYTILMKRAPSTGVPKDSFREGAFFKGDRWLPGSRKALSDSVKDLLTKLLSAKPHERPSCEEILAHEWMSVEDDESEDESEDGDEEKENTAILKEKTKLRDNGGVSRKNFLSMVPRLQVPIAPPTTRSQTGAQSHLPFLFPHQDLKRVNKLYDTTSTVVYCISEKKHENKVKREIKQLEGINETLYFSDAELKIIFISRCRSVYCRMPKVRHKPKANTKLNAALRLAYLAHPQ